MFISGDVRSASMPASHLVGQSFHGMGAFGGLNGVLGFLSAMTAEERKAKQAAAQADRLAKHAAAVADQQEKRAARATTQQEHQAATQAAAQAKQVQRQATAQSKAATQAATKAAATAKQVAKKAALQQKKLLGRTLNLTPQGAAVVSKIAPAIEDTAKSIQTAMAAVLKARSSRNPADRSNALALVKTATSKMQSVGAAGASTPARGVRGLLGLGDVVVDPNTGQYVDSTTGQPVDPNTGLPIGGTTNPYGTTSPYGSIDPNTGLPYTTSSSPYGVPGLTDPTGLFAQPYSPTQIPAACQKNPNKPVCMTLIMQQQEQAQMQSVFSLLQNMFAQLMDLVNQLLAQNFQTSQAAAAGSIYGQGIPPSPYGDPYGSPYGSPYGDPYGGAPGYYGGYSQGGDVSAIPAGYDVGGADMYGGGGDAATNAAYASAGPGQSTGPYGGPAGPLPPGYGNPSASNIISSDSMPLGTDDGGDVYGGGDASQIAPPSVFGSDTNYGLPPPQQYAQPPMQVGPTPQQMQMMMANQAMSASFNQGPGAQGQFAASGPVYAQGGSVYMPDGSPQMFGQQPSYTYPVGASDTVPPGTAMPQYQSAGLTQQLQLPGPGGDELVAGEEFN